MERQQCEAISLFQALNGMVLFSRRLNDEKRRLLTNECIHTILFFLHFSVETAVSSRDACCFCFYAFHR